MNEIYEVKEKQQLQIFLGCVNYIGDFNVTISLIKALLQRLSNSFVITKLY